MGNDYNDYIDIATLKNYKGFHMNIRSLYHKIDTLRNDIFDHNLGIFGITETWLNERTPNSLIIVRDFCLIRNDRRKGRGGGTCLYIRDDLEFTVPSNAVNIKDVEIQSAILLGRKDHQAHKPILIVLMYRPPNGNSIVANNTIIDYIKDINEYEKKEIVIMGDLNWDIADDANIGCKFINEIAECFSLEQIVKVPTRIALNSSTLIDVILTNVRNIAYSGCINYQVSDHYPVYLVKKRLPNIKEYKRSFRAYDRVTFQEN